MAGRRKPSSWAIPPGLDQPGIVFVRNFLHRLIEIEPVGPSEVLAVREPRKVFREEIKSGRRFFAFLVDALRLIAV